MSVYDVITSSLISTSKSNGKENKILFSIEETVLKFWKCDQKYDFWAHSFTLGPKQALKSLVNDVIITSFP